MCQCLSFLVTDPFPNQRWVAWKRSFVLLFERVRMWARMLTSTEVELFRVVRFANRDSVRMLRDGSAEASMLPNGAIHNAKQPKGRDLIAIRCANPASSRKKDVKKQGGSMMNGTHARKSSYRSSINGGSDFASLFTRQGLKGVNQDAMLVWEDFGAQTDAIFCGVFDGHGPHGHLVARNVRDMLPRKIASCRQALQELRSASKKGTFHCFNEAALDSEGGFGGDPQLISEWQESFLNAYKLVDRELLIDDNVDCISSGTTAVTLVKQGNDLIIGNVGDSRAVLGVRDDDNSLLALQLTIDLTPNRPKEAQRIRRCRGRVFALPQEPTVKRVWLPHHNSPGLAMARALGDFSLKNFGVISVPEITYRRLTEKDEFFVLATDGVWDVLSNEQVVEIVASTTARSLAAKAVVDTAVRLWRSKYPTAKVDDCAVVCLFLDDAPCAVTNNGSLSKDDFPCFIEADSLARRPQVLVNGSNIEPGRSEETEEVGLDTEEHVWSALGGVTWNNTIVNLPKFVPVAQMRYR